MENQIQPLSITDLALLRNVIDIACSRGAFKANEMKPVGEVYDKLNSFLSAVIAQAEAQAAETAKQGETK